MSNISAVSSPADIYQANKALMNNEPQEVESADFGSMLSNAISEVDNLHTVASEGTQALLAGEVDNISQIMIDGTKAELALNLVIQVRNKALDAYNEIMRMQL